MEIKEQNSLENFDPMAWANNQVETAPNTYQNDDVAIQVRLLTEIIKQRCIDITSGYENWLNLGFALADGMGEEGRSYYHDLSSMNGDYNHAECDKQYNACLRSHGQGITIKTFFQMAKDAGIDISEVARRCATPTVDNAVVPEIIEKFSHCIVSMDAVYPANEFLFSVDDIPVITLGDIHTIGAKQKGGKTSLVSIFIAAILGGQWNHVKSLRQNVSVLYIDTEMKPIDTQQLAEKAASMASRDRSAISQQVHLVNFRPLTPTEMKEGMRYFIDLYKTQLVVIDGVVDLCSKFNDVEASQKLVIDFLMKMAEENNCAIINILHTNKTDGYAELRGHLGAFFEQKGATVIKCEKDDKNNIVTVKFPTHRYAPVPEFHFAFDSHGVPVCGDTQYQAIEDAKRLSAEELKVEKQQKLYAERKTAVIAILRANGGSMNRKSLIDEAMKQLGKGSSTVSELIKKMKEEPTPSICEEQGEIKLCPV